jgi:hypothetical protein
MIGNRAATPGSGAARHNRICNPEAETEMAQPALRNMFVLVDESGPAPGEWRPSGARPAREAHEFPSRRAAEDEAGYCLARAEAEARWASEATHPAARRAHLRLAAIYRRRALDARQAQAAEIQDWASEGGSVPAIV